MNFLTLVLSLGVFIQQIFIEDPLGARLYSRH